MSVAVSVAVLVGVLVGVKVVVAVGVLVAKKVGMAANLFIPSQSSAAVAPHTRIIPKAIIEILGFSKGSLSVGLGVSFMPFLLLTYGRLGI